MVGSQTNKVSFEITSASSSPLAINFVYDQNSWLKVEFYATDGGEVEELESGIDYVYGGSGPASTGTITLQSSFLTGITSGTLVAYRDTPPLQETDFTYNDRLPSTLLERSLDRLTRSVQDAILTGQTFRFPQSDPSEFEEDYTLPAASVRKTQQFLMFSPSDGRPIYVTAQDVANVILDYFGEAPTAADVLAAISALGPIVTTSIPNSFSSIQAGQLWVVPKVLEHLTVGGFLEYNSEPVTVPNLPLFGTFNGRKYYRILVESVDNFAAWTGSLWIISSGSASWTSNENVTTPDLVTAWTPVGLTGGDPEVTLVAEVAGRLFTNLAEQSNPNDLVEFDLTPI